MAQSDACPTDDQEVVGLTELGAFMRTEFLCISVLRVASGPRVKLPGCGDALPPPPPPPPGGLLCRPF